MFNRYKKIALRYKLVVFLGVTLLAWVSTMHTPTPALLPVGVAALLLCTHLFLTFRSHLVLVVSVILYIVLNTGVALGVYTYGEEISMVTGLNLDLTAAMFGSVQLVALLSFIFLAYNYSRGGMAFNFIAAWVIQFAALMTVLLINFSYYTLALILGTAAGIIFLLLRLPNRRKKPDVMRASTPVSLKNKKRIEEMLTEAGLEYSEDIPESLQGVDYLAYNEASAYAITIIQARNSAVMNEYGLIIDGATQAPLLELVQSELKSGGKTTRKLIHIFVHVDVFHASKPSIPSTLLLKVHKWKQPDHVLGVTTVCDLKGFRVMMRALKGEMKKKSWSDNQRTVSKLSELTQKSANVN